MPAWNEARRAGGRSRNKALAERAAPGNSNVAIPMAARRWKAGVCVYCGKKGRLRVGRMAISGNVYFCAQHATQYHDDKAWEEKHKREMGL